MSERPSRKHEQQEALSPVNQLQKTVRSDDEVKRILAMRAIRKIDVMCTEFGLRVIMIGGEISKFESLPTITLDFEVSANNEYAFLEIKDRLLRHFKQPIDVAKISNNTSTDLSRFTEATDKEKMLHIARRYEGSADLVHEFEYTDHLRVPDKPYGWRYEKREAFALKEWINKWQQIERELTEKNIVAFWWDAKRNKLHIVYKNEANSKDEESDDSLRQSVVEESIAQMLKQHGINDRVTILDNDTDKRVGRSLTLSTNIDEEDEDGDEDEEMPEDDESRWTSALGDKKLRITTNQNGILIDEVEIDSLMEDLKTALSEIEEDEKIAIIIQPLLPKSDDDKPAWRESLEISFGSEENERRWNIACYIDLPDPEDAHE